MRFGVCGPVSLLETAKRTGFDYLEMQVTAVASWSEEEFEANCKKIQEVGLECRCFNELFPGDMALIGDQADASRRDLYLHKAFARLQKLGGEIVVFGSGRARKKPEGLSFFEAYRQLVEVTYAIGTIAAQYGLTIVIEPLNRTECDLINSMAEGAQLVSDVDLENVRLLSDFYHVATDHEPISDITRIGAFSHIHVASRHARRYPLPGQPDDYKQYFHRLKDIGYQGRISVEGGAEDIEAEGRLSLAYLRKIWEEA